MGNNEMDTNKVIIAGKIKNELEFSHSIYGEAFYNTYIEISRLSDIKDVLPISVSERLIQGKKLKVGDYVSVEGQLRSYNKMINGNNKLVLLIFVKELELISSREEIENPNQIYLDGFICKSPSYRTTPFGREITDLLVAVNRPYNKSDYIPCIAWGRNARFCGNLKIGQHLNLWGRIQSREYQKKYPTGEIVNKVAYEVSISKMELLNEKEVQDQETV
ncbi:Single-strand binding protein family protein [Garciella nitratireducens DSM 15102]|uniref:Single-strand binding protein family protein n=2 Tax=Garciella TaxID=218204 RepID=A0A1T4LKJ3_9FIRM|nr:Single-strand binding protein family protein [Garciella nitratireducens DSM 15102]